MPIIYPGLRLDYKVATHPLFDFGLAPFEGSCLFVVSTDEVIDRFAQLFDIDKAGLGAVISVADSTFYRLRQKLCKEMRVRCLENCLRNSYATYAQTFRSSGDVARAMGDAESTVIRF